MTRKYSNFEFYSYSLGTLILSVVKLVFKGTLSSSAKEPSPSLQPSPWPFLAISHCSPPLPVAFITTPCLPAWWENGSVWMKHEDEEVWRTASSAKRLMMTVRRRLCKEVASRVLWYYLPLSLSTYYFNFTASRPLVHIGLVIAFLCVATGVNYLPGLHDNSSSVHQPKGTCKETASKPTWTTQCSCPSVFLSCLTLPRVKSKP